ncbi:hypothetical protein [Achromobacter xylosoxidans]|uniref:Uncharacterized protein n=1 Tax=Achromobacter xylosoxidans (strain A8) TaxID=762376 RepID=E3HGM4_ACHXA|nr:hypothetical protein [Achromobacter xylosoxidans]ADP15360.1 hypothetical protein AXYL_02031 [Achromobacter xylosoxidans A8]
MSFHTTIARLREASYAAPAAGEDPNTCRVGRQDLRTTLHLMDRLDADVRCSSMLVQGMLAAAPTPPSSAQDVITVSLDPDPRGVSVGVWQGSHCIYTGAHAVPVAPGEAQEDLAPPKCPITGRPFFMALEHPELGMVPTYGGPYDSYTIPHLGGKPDQPWHERELLVYRYDHDLGGWITDEAEVIPLRIVHEDVLHGLEDAAPQASEAVRDAGIAASEDVDEKMREVLQWIVDDAASGGVAKLRPPQEKRARAALSAQPGAQKEPSPEWMTCDKRGWMVRESLARNGKQMRADEKRCRNAYTEEYMGAPTRYLADVFADAAVVFEKRLKELPPQKKGDK